ncbi:MAG: 16S rRNA (adenine(1518)-N(6)/adenine(1519)-N(6))-dimethyltransferase RsmA [Nitrospirota bacterium]|jgi:16S rRNA (adenine1518-N6/adenine1519-N6)-dimethyltransferase
MPSPAELCRRFGLRPDKRIGQHFLADPAVVEAILDRAALNHADRVVEIGPGLGVMTLPLAQRAAHVTAIEVDPRLVAFLRQQLPASAPIDVVEADALRFDFRSLPAPPYRLVANLPYHITSPLLLHLLDQGHCFTDLTVMVQREVADRLLASPGEKDFGRLTLRVAYASEVASLLPVPADAFYPPPQVDSTIVRLSVRPVPAVTVADPDAFFALIQRGYQSRRKTLANNLKGLPGFTPNALTACLADLGHPANVRAERLSLADWARVLELLG